MEIVDEFPNDPFFKRGPDSEWNACIGSQGEEYNYVIGYMQAATDLVNAVIDNKDAGKRDTLVLPILYNARHAVELALKYCGRRLVRANLIPGPIRPEHSVLPLWQMLADAKVGDRVLAKSIGDLKPFIDSFTAVDDDGQELRYHRNIADDPSLANYSIANLEVIRDSLVPLSEIVDVLLFRTSDFLRERATGTFTSRCSRQNLSEIVAMLPPLAQWNKAIFDEAKVKIRADFDLTSNEFSKAVDKIKESREFCARLGRETPMQYLTDDLVVEAMMAWRTWHPKREPSGGLRIIRGEDISLERIFESNKKKAVVVAEIKKLLTPQQFGELAAIFFLARDGYFSEYFSERVHKEIASYEAKTDPVAQIVYLFDKANLLSELTRGAAQIGRLALAERLAAL